ncbi:hypothetical protein RSOL_365320, partial [Rhizoctonia solani AG-3 Rhs1AP]
MKDSDYLACNIRTRLKGLDPTMSIQTPVSLTGPLPATPSDSNPTQPEASLPSMSLDGATLPSLSPRPITFQAGSPLSRLLDHIYGILSYEESQRPPSLSPASSLSRPLLLPPPKPSEEIYLKVAAVNQLIDLLFPSRSNICPSLTRPDDLTSAPLEANPRTPSLSIPHQPDQCLLPIREYSMCRASLIPLPTRKFPKAMELQTKSKGKEPEAKEEESEEELEKLPDLEDLETPEYWEEQEWED